MVILKSSIVKLDITIYYIEKNDDCMERLNYQHLFYFWSVAKEGGVTRACETLHLAQPTISGQLAVFERSIGTKLFRRDGRKLVLTDTGRIVYRYAEEIFSIGRELTNTLKGQTIERGLRFNIGLADALPKLIAYRLIEPALRLPEPVQITCYEDTVERLLFDLSMHSLDLVLSDSPATASTGTRTFNHILGECGIVVLATRSLAARFRINFPHSLDQAPLLLPTPSTALRRSLDQWFDVKNIYPHIKAEIQDSALLKTFASAGVGLIFAPIAVAKEIQYQYGIETVGQIDEIRERFYAISAQRKLKHPATLAILKIAQARMFEGLQT